MLAYVRRNIVAFIALFMSFVAIGGATAYAANTVRSADIVDGQVKNADLGADSVASGKIIDNSVLGADIRESTLNRVPDAGHLAGVPAAAFRTGSYTVSQVTSDCVTAGPWSECAAIFVTVPAGHVYRITVFSTVTVHEGASGESAGFCPAKGGPTCINGNPEEITFRPNEWTSASSVAQKYFPAGTYKFSTALHFQFAILADNYAHSTTTVEFSDPRSQDVG